MTTKKSKTDEPKGMKIMALQVENVKRVKWARIRPVGNLIEIAGQNGSGKSSVLDAIDYALTGTGNHPSQPIRKGAQSARIQLQIGAEKVEFNIERTFTKVNGGKTDHLTKLTVRGTEGQRWDEPQTILNKLLGAISFDPLEFIRMEPKKQFATLRQLVTVDLEAIETAKQEAYEARRMAGRDVDAAKARLAAKREPAADLPAEKIDTKELTDKLASAITHNGGIDRAKQTRQELNRRGDEAAYAITEIEGQIAALERRLEATHESLRSLRAEAEAIQIGEPIDVDVTTAELTAALEINGDIIDREAYRSIEAQLKEAEERWTENDSTVKAKDKERADAIASTKLPIDELTIGDGEVLYRSLPFNQASNADQIRVSVALAIACNPKLRVLRIKDGALLDGKSLATIAEMAKSNDYQIWMERVEPHSDVAVVMEEGEAKGEQTEAAPQVKA